MIRLPFERRRRERQAIACLSARSAAKDAFRHAVVRQDCRAIHETGEALKAATTALLSAEVALAKATKRRA